eukprot:SAG11_NODE_3390_length_2478_cov_2.929382_1_plen_106_part_00
MAHRVRFPRSDDSRRRLEAQLRTACFLADFETASTLLGLEDEARVDVGCVDSKRTTPLHYACACEALAMTPAEKDVAVGRTVALLLSAGESLGIGACHFKSPCLL